MLFKQFVKITSSYWRAYLNSVAKLVADGKLGVSHGGMVLYPSFLLCIENAEYFIAEIIRAHRECDLTVKVQKEPSIDRYLNQFNAEAADPAIRLSDSRNIRFEGLILAQKAEIDD